LFNAKLSFVFWSGIAVVREECSIEISAMDELSGVDGAESNGEDQRQQQYDFGVPHETRIHALSLAGNYLPYRPKRGIVLNLKAGG
jgi:hypothetical protein